MIPYLAELSSACGPLVPVVGLYGRATAEHADILSILETNPAFGGQVLDRLVQTMTEEMKGNDRSLYLLQGADPAHSTPMQYGGHFLEREREILSSLPKDRLVIYVVGGEGAYLDFVSDLPAEVFAWSTEGSGFSLDQMRSLRSGTLATTDENADIVLPSNREAEMAT